MKIVDTGQQTCGGYVQARVLAKEHCFFECLPVYTIRYTAHSVALISPDFRVSS
jgi:hypothetical protein